MRDHRNLPARLLPEPAPTRRHQRPAAMGTLIISARELPTESDLQRIHTELNCLTGADDPIPYSLEDRS